MKELDLLKKDWKKDKISFEQVSEGAIYKMLHKKSRLTYEEIRERYEHFRARCKNKKQITAKIRKAKENGCTEPIYGYKAKCILTIVPSETKCESFQIQK